MKKSEKDTSFDWYEIYISDEYIGGDYSTNSKKIFFPEKSIYAGYYTHLPKKLVYNYMVVITMEFRLSLVPKDRKSGLSRLWIKGKDFADAFAPYEAEIEKVRNKFLEDKALKEKAEKLSISKQQFKQKGEIWFCYVYYKYLKEWYSDICFVSKDKKGKIFVDKQSYKANSSDIVLKQMITEGSMYEYANLQTYNFAKEYDYYLKILGEQFDTVSQKRKKYFEMAKKDLFKENKSIIDDLTKDFLLSNDL